MTGGDGKMSYPIGWADEISITIRHGDDTYYANISDVPEGMHADDIAETLFGIARDAIGQDEGISVEDRRTRHELGASGATWQFIVELAENISQDAAQAAILAAFTKIARKLTNDRESTPLDRESALSMARFRLVLNYEPVSESALTVASEEYDSTSTRWTFVFDPIDGCEYSAEVGAVAGLPAVTRMGKARTGK